MLGAQSAQEYETYIILILEYSNPFQVSLSQNCVYDVLINGIYRWLTHLVVFLSVVYGISFTTFILVASKSTVCFKAHIRPRYKVLK